MVKCPSDSVIASLFATKSFTVAPVNGEPELLISLPDKAHPGVVKRQVVTMPIPNGNARIEKYLFCMIAPLFAVIGQR